MKAGSVSPDFSLTHLSRLGAQTMARFLECMLVSDEYEAILTR